MREGRDATRQEVLTSMKEGLPALVDEAKQDGVEGLQALQVATAKALQLVPRAA